MYGYYLSPYNSVQHFAAAIRLCLQFQTGEEKEIDRQISKQRDKKRDLEKERKGKDQVMSSILYREEKEIVRQINRYRQIDREIERGK